MGASCRRRLTMYDYAVFRIRIQGALDENWSDYFGTQSMSVEVGENEIATTTFVTEALDQSALFGLLNRLNALGLPLLAVECLSIEQETVDRFSRAFKDGNGPIP